MPPVPQRIGFEIFTSVAQQFRVLFLAEGRRYFAFGNDRKFALWQKNVALLADAREGRNGEHANAKSDIIRGHKLVDT